jgi:hypothetical protein
MDAAVADLLHWARAVTAGHDGDAAGRFHHFEQMQVPALTRLAAAARVAAAVHAGEPARAEQWTTQMEAFPHTTGLPWATAVAP